MKFFLYKIHFQKQIFLFISLLSCLSCGMLLMRYNQNQWLSIEIKEGINKSISGKIIGKEERQDKTYYTIAQNGYLVLVSSNTNRYPIQATVVATGSLRSFKEASNDGEYNEKSYYEGKNIAFALDDSKIKILKLPLFPISEYLFQFRIKIGGFFQENLSQKNAGTLTAMMTGDKQYLNPETKENYQEGGIAHLLAISGTHLSILILGFYQSLRTCKCSYAKTAFLSALILICFSSMTGVAISTLRAGEIGRAHV